MKNPSPKKNVTSPWILSGLRPSRMTVAIGSVALLLAACGGDSGNASKADGDDSGISEPQQASIFDYVAEALDDLVVCCSRREGMTAYIAEKQAAYLCQNNSWVELGLVMDTFDDLPVCSVKREGMAAYVNEEKEVYFCIGKDWTLDADANPDSDSWEESSNSKGTSSAETPKSSSSQITESSSGEILESSSSSVMSSSSIPKSSSSSSAISSSSSAVSSSSIPKSSSSSSAISSSSSVMSSSSIPKSSSSSSAISSSSSVMSSSSIPKSSSSSSARSSSSSRNTVDPSTVVKGTMTDSRDDQTYKTVKIGTQTWMAENLNYETGSSFCYKDLTKYCTEYGRLYTWAAAMDSAGTWSTNGKGCGWMGSTCSPTYPVRGVCPEGWHLPTEKEWITLKNALNSSFGKALKSTGGWFDGGNGTDAYSFSALPAGWKSLYGAYEFRLKVAAFWSSTQYDRCIAQNAYLDYDTDGSATGRYPDNKKEGYSVRCIKNSN